MSTAKDTVNNIISGIEEKFEKLIASLRDKISGNDEITDAQVLEVKQHAAAGLANLAGTVDTSGANVPLDPNAKVPNTNATGADTVNANNTGTSANNTTANAAGNKSSK